MRLELAYPRSLNILSFRIKLQLDPDRPADKTTFAGDQ